MSLKDLNGEQEFTQVIPKFQAHRLSFFVVIFASTFHDPKFIQVVSVIFCLLGRELDISISIFSYHISFNHHQGYSRELIDQRQYNHSPELKIFPSFPIIYLVSSCRFYKSTYTKKSHNFTCHKQFFFYFILQISQLKFSFDAFMTMSKNQSSATKLLTNKQIKKLICAIIMK